MVDSDREVDLQIDPSITKSLKIVQIEGVDLQIEGVDRGVDLKMKFSNRGVDLQIEGVDLQIEGSIEGSIWANYNFC